MSARCLQAATQDAPSEVLTSHKYCEDVYRSRRRPTRTVKVLLSFACILSSSIHVLCCTNTWCSQQWYERVAAQHL